MASFSLDHKEPESVFDEDNVNIPSSPPVGHRNEDPEHPSFADIVPERQVSDEPEIEELPQRRKPLVFTKRKSDGSDPLLSSPATKVSKSLQQRKKVRIAAAAKAQVPVAPESSPLSSARSNLGTSPAFNHVAESAPAAPKARRGRVPKVKGAVGIRRSTRVKK